MDSSKAVDRKAAVLAPVPRNRVRQAVKKANKRK